MANSELDGLVAELSKLKTQGHTAVSLDTLLPYATALANSARTRDPESERQRIELEFENQLEQFRAQKESNLEMFKAVIEAGQSALKALSLVNGAAAVAILSFLGAILSKQGGTSLPLVPSMKWAMVIFAMGVGFSALGFVFRYLSQGAYKKDFHRDLIKATRLGDILRNCAIVSGGSSLISFFVRVSGLRSERLLRNRGTLLRYYARKRSSVIIGKSSAATQSPSALPPRSAPPACSRRRCAGCCRRSRAAR